MEADATYLRSYFGNPAAYNLRRLPWTGESLRFYRWCVSFDFRPTHRYLHDRRFYIFDRPRFFSLHDFSNFRLLLDSVKYEIKEIMEKLNLFGIMRAVLDNNLSNNLFLWIDQSQVVDRWLFSRNFSISWEISSRSSYQTCYCTAGEFPLVILVQLRQKVTGGGEILNWNIFIRGNIFSTTPYSYK